ncbi:hypothetical protein E3P99_03879 [Wallemia hederae]|uniref:Uncharacterized protein n=1 Tax=Wallemia hederae TaxID=1540922 RepID=A0A4T0FF92_9BASI|nr:hypothetical protein E3P99_03879 [Wallemia hederae]
MKRRAGDSECGVDVECCSITTTIAIGKWGAMSEAQSLIDSMLAHHTIAVVIYSSLPSCQSVVDNISLLNIRSQDLVVLDLDGFDQEEATEIRQYLYLITNRYDLPFVFYRGRDIPSEYETLVMSFFDSLQAYLGSKRATSTLTNCSDCFMRVCEG